MPPQRPWPTRPWDPLWTCCWADGWKPPLIQQWSAALHWRLERSKWSSRITLLQLTTPQTPSQHVNTLPYASHRTEPHRERPRILWPHCASPHHEKGTVAARHIITSDITPLVSLHLALSALGFQAFISCVDPAVLQSLACTLSGVLGHVWPMF